MGYEVTGCGSFTITAANHKRAQTDPVVLALPSYRYNDDVLLGRLAGQGFETSGPDDNGDWDVCDFDGKWRDQEDLLQALSSYLDGSMDFQGEDGDQWTIDIKNGVFDSYNPKAENEAALGEYKALVSSMFASGSSEVMDWVIQRGLESKSRVVKEHIKQLINDSSKTK
jgi:hypothetical protein